MNSKHQKSDAFQVAIQLLVVTAKEIYMRTQAVCAKHLMLIDDILNVFNFQQRCCLHIVITTYVK